MHKFFKNISIIKRLTLAYILLILIPSIFVMVSLYRASNRQIELEMNYMNKNVLEQVAYSILAVTLLCLYYLFVSFIQIWGNT